MDGVAGYGAIGYLILSILALRSDKILIPDLRQDRDRIELYVRY